MIPLHQYRQLVVPLLNQILTLKTPTILIEWKVVLPLSLQDFKQTIPQEKEDSPAKNLRARTKKVSYKLNSEFDDDSDKEIQSAKKKKKHVTTIRQSKQTVHLPPPNEDDVKT